MKTDKNTTKNLEMRFSVSEMRVERAAEKPAKLVGYAAVFNSLSCDLGGFKERIVPGAFKDSVSNGQDVRALCDHDHTRLLGRTSNNTLRLSEDERGLRAEVLLPDTSYARDLMASVERGDINGMSFGFQIPPNGERWTKENDYAVRELTQIDLREVTATSVPAYQATELYLRVSPQCEAKAAEVRDDRKNFRACETKLRTILANG
jgi:HK97 family phage prohead protease